MPCALRRLGLAPGGRRGRAATPGEGRLPPTASHSPPHAHLTDVLSPLPAAAVEPLAAEPRAEAGSIPAGKLRREGRVPAVVFSFPESSDVTDSKLLSLDAKVVSRIVQKQGRMGWACSLFDLQIAVPGGSEQETIRALVRPWAHCVVTDVWGPHTTCQACLSGPDCAACPTSSAAQVLVWGCTAWGSAAGHGTARHGRRLGHPGHCHRASHTCLPCSAPLFPACTPRRELVRSVCSRCRAGKCTFGQIQTGSRTSPSYPARLTDWSKWTCPCK